ncbi:hypothetical protein [Citrobacter koseri]|uniref:hypothetical protein n=1 Tax=Citrobacter koseri TaxID=545 RepID=UPI001A1D3970|nr:hypothetical protein [Citrobacter koseri]MDT7486810.1 hypothetical protein [Citrobacter koseri]HAT3905358.1 hypothetical protein [Citrobacter koseri]
MKINDGAKRFLQEWWKSMLSYNGVSYFNIQKYISSLLIVLLIGGVFFGAIYCFYGDEYSHEIKIFLRTLRRALF